MSAQRKTVSTTWRDRFRSEEIRERCGKSRKIELVRRCVETAISSKNGSCRKVSTFVSRRNSRRRTQAVLIQKGLQILKMQKPERARR